MINHFAVFMFEGVVTVQCREGGTEGRTYYARKIW
jgi:hypothetical protein